MVKYSPENEVWLPGVGLYNCWINGGLGKAIYSCFQNQFPSICSLQLVRHDLLLRSDAGVDRIQRGYVCPDGHSHCGGKKGPEECPGQAEGKAEGYPIGQSDVIILYV